ncbi:MAG TPA: SulP family inorganic anion transporter [Chloroflexia bacterium]|nr:SulP family inorganic anion transporter [Chloroflexia bacterium]
MVKNFALFKLWQREFKGYSMAHARRDLVAGLTVAAVALPLALAFGVASSATAAAGLVTAIISGFVIGALSGAPYQVSGPTGAMSAVLVVIVQKYGLKGLWIAGLMAGFIILLLGLFKLGRVINFIPAPVITGFTSGIAVIIFTGQVDNFFGIKTPAADSSILKLVGYFTHPLPAINWQSVICAVLVIATMLTLPRLKYTASIPAALAGITLVTVLSWLMNWPVAQIGTIPSSIILEDRYHLDFSDLKLAGDLIGPAVAIAMLGGIESLLAGVVAGRMTGIKLNGNQELIAQGVGNLVLPFFGGVPATAAIARISVGVKAGGMTRLVSLIHSLSLLLCGLFLGSYIGRIPLAGLAGVLMVTAWRMNEWHIIRFYLKRRLKSPTFVMLVTLVATAALDLTQAIIIGVVLSLFLFINQVSRLDIVPTEVDWQRLRAAGHVFSQEVPDMRVIYISGSLFFGAAGQFMETLERVGLCRVTILSMRGVPVIDASGLHAIEHIYHLQQKSGGLLFISGLQPQVRKLFERAGLVESLGQEHYTWSADQAITTATRLLASEQQEGWHEYCPAAPEQADREEELEVVEMPLGVVKME